MKDSGPQLTSLRYTLNFPYTLIRFHHDYVMFLRRQNLRTLSGSRGFHEASSHNPSLFDEVIKVYEGINPIKRKAVEKKLHN